MHCVCGAFPLTLGSFLAPRRNADLAASVCAAQTSTLAACSATNNLAPGTTSVSFASAFGLCPTRAAFNGAPFPASMSDALSIALLERVAPVDLALGSGLQLMVFLLLLWEGKCEHFGQNFER